MTGLLLGCADPEEKQFAGLRLPDGPSGGRAAGLRVPAVARDGRCDCRWRRRLDLVLVSGHGVRDRAAFRSPPG